MRALLAITLLVVGCGGSGGAPAPQAQTSRCVAVPQALVDAIGTGLTVSGGGTLGAAKAVKSNDFSKVWFVASRITGPSLNEVGVWATNDLGGGGLIYAADGFASEFSDWGKGPGFSIADDGAQEAKDCVG